MKQITLLITLFLASCTVFAQDLVITGIFDGNLTGGTPKAIEIYALNDIADLSTYGFSNSSNGNGISEVEFAFSGSATAGDYFYISTNEEDFMTFFGFTPDFISNSANNNGDDSIAIYDSVADDGSGTLQGTQIDVYGDLDTDGTGEAWEYQDGWAYRVSGTGPDGTTFMVGNFTYSGTNANDDDTTQADATNPWPIGTYSTTPPACSLVLGTATATCDTETTAVDGTTVMIPYTGGGDATYTVAITSGGGVVGGDDPTTTANGTITLTEVSEDVTITLEVTSTDCMLSIDVTTPACEPATEVADIAALRAGTVGEEYTLTGEAVLTFQQDFRNQKFIEDATGAILIDDSAATITTAFNVADGITGITGVLGDFNGMTQFIPSVDPGAATSTGNTITPQEVTVTELAANPNDYESEYVRITGLTIDNSTNSSWVNGQEYPMTNTDGSYIFRTTFFDVDYIGEVVPADEANISGIINERNNGEYFITARDAADIEADAVEATEVATLADLRAGTEGTLYTLTGEAILTFQQDFRNQKFIEDDTAAILIDDSAATITTAYNVGDGIVGLTGTLSSFQGMLQFVPSEDPGDAFSTGNTITAQMVTVTELAANPNDYEAEYVTLTEATIDTATNTDWVTGTEYGLTTPEGAYTFRTTFFDADYIGTAVPTEAQNISGIITERNDGDYFITARGVTDFEEFLSIGETTAVTIAMFPNPASDQITISTGVNIAMNVSIFEITGKKVIETTTANPIDVSALASGVYVVQVADATSSTTAKLVIK